jgi:hypothetical protein
MGATSSIECEERRRPPTPVAAWWETGRLVPSVRESPRARSIRARHRPELAGSDDTVLEEPRPL